MIETSETTAKLDAALAKAQGEFVAALKDSSNPAFRSKYADLTAVMEAIRPSLTKHGISVTQWPVHSEDNRVHMVTRIAHDGEWMRGTFSMPVMKADAHGYGSIVSYLRRYCISACLGVISDVDDDGNAAVARPTEKPATPPQKATKPLSVHTERTYPGPDTAELTGTAGAPSNAAAKELFATLTREMEQAKTVEALKEWLKLRRPDVDKLPEKWMGDFENAYFLHKDSLAGVAV